MKYRYTYDKLAKTYTVTRDGLSSAPFSNLRDCKLSWKHEMVYKWKGLLQCRKRKCRQYRQSRIRLREHTS